MGRRDRRTLLLGVPKPSILAARWGVLDEVGQDLSFYLGPAMVPSWSAEKTQVMRWTLSPPPEVPGLEDLGDVAVGSRARPEPRIETCRPGTTPAGPDWVVPTEADSSARCLKKISASSELTWINRCLAARVGQADLRWVAELLIALASWGPTRCSARRGKSR